MNYFTGLFTTADDWRREQAYHVHKHRLHNRTLHTPGVVMGEGENLAVTVTEEGRLMVLSGYAVDARGRDLYLAEPITLDVPSEVERSVANEEVLRYVSISFSEKKRDPRPDHLNPQYSGDAFIEEHPVVEWASEVPDQKNKIELARIRWRASQRITKDRIDTSHVPAAGTRSAGGGITLCSQGETKVVRGEVKLLVGEPCDPGRAPGSLFVANVFPREQGRAGITWSMESSMTEHGQVQYHLWIKTNSEQPVNVAYEVYRLEGAGGQ
jgi:hypothetical protein